jgi:hypothetical protein
MTVVGTPTSASKIGESMSIYFLDLDMCKLMSIAIINAPKDASADM